MDGGVLRVAWYRFRATFGSRWGSYLAVVLLIGLLGGVAMGSIAAGRRTQSSYPRFLASTNPSDLYIASFAANASAASFPSVQMADEVAQLPQVKQVKRLALLNATPLASNGAPDLTNTAQVATLGSVDGLLFDQDRVAVIQGRMANPSRPDEFVVTGDGARALGLHIGQVVPLGIYTNEQTAQPGFGTPSVAPHVRVNAKLVGIVVLNNQIVQDDVDRSPFALFTPAVSRQMLPDSPALILGLQLDHGSRDVAAVEQAIVGLLPPGTTYNFHVTSLVSARVERAIKPEAIALGVFGVIAGLATMFIVLQAIARQLRSRNEDLQVLRALGASPALTASDGLLGVLGAVVLGSLLAAAVAVGLSSLAPLGPVRPFYPASGIAFDRTVLGLGIVILIGGLGAAAIVLSYLGVPHHVARRSRLLVARGSSAARFAASSGLPPPAVAGVRFALEPGRGRTEVPVRSALLGTGLAVVMVVATLTFGSGLRTLVSRPGLYGWNWSYALSPSNVVPPAAVALLDHDAAVEAWTGVHVANAQIDGQNVPILLGSPNAAVSPPILSGHALGGNDQIVVGAATLARLRKHIGDTVVVTYGSPQDAPVYVPPTRLTIVGTTTMPAIGFSSLFADHPSMGTGALIPVGIEPAAFQQALLNTDPNLNGPDMVFVRLRPNVSSSAGTADMQRIADAANKSMAADPNTAGNSVAVLGVQHPAEIVNYRSVGATPVVLACGLAVGAIAALGLTLASSVRRRRRDLALLKALGFTKRQLTAAVAWQATVAAVIGTVFGVPVGVALGRQLWILFARNIDAVPEPTVPVWSVFLVGVGALVFANVVAALPGRAAGRTPAALVLRAE